MLGHKDHGKSTLIGSILIATGSVSKERIENAKRRSKRLGRRFEPGFLLDSFEEEQDRALTIDTTRAQVMHKGTGFEFIDVPGHEELIKNMISGASYADFAILLVSAKAGEGIKDQTKRHLFLARMMGMDRIVVCVNKMDTVDYDVDTFDSIKKGLGVFLSDIGFDKGHVHFIPVSAYDSENLSSSSKKMEWYDGGSLLDLLVKVSKDKQTERGPLRFSFQGVLDNGGKALHMGIVVGGALRKNDRIVVAPSGERGTVTSVFVKGKKKSIARQGENAALEIEGIKNMDHRGMVGCHTDDVIHSAKSINTTIFAMEGIRGKTVIAFNGLELDCSIGIINGINTTTGKKTGWKAARALEAASAKISLSSDIAAEPFSKSKEMGSFTIHSKNRIVGIGIIN